MPPVFLSPPLEKKIIQHRFFIMHLLYQYTTHSYTKEITPQLRQIFYENSHPATFSQRADCVRMSVYLTSLQPICWRSSCLSVSELRGRMFFSSSSFLLGRFPSLMFRVSRRRILMAKEPSIEMQQGELVTSFLGP